MEHNKRKYEAFDECVKEDGERSPEAYAHYASKNRWLNPDLVSEDEVNSISRSMVEYARHPMHLGILGASQPKKTARAVDSIDEALLFQQIQTPGSFVMHNFTSQSVYYERLYSWPLFNDVTELLMAPIKLLCKRAPFDIPAKATALYEMQCRIAHSEYHQLSALSFMTSAEEIMGALLVKILLKVTTVVFVFRWPEDPAFMFFISFVNTRPSWNKSDFASNEVLALHSDDITIDHSPQSDDDDDIDERDTKSSRNNTAKRDTQFISFYGDKINVTFIEKFKNDVLDYLNYGYIRKVDD